LEHLRFDFDDLKGLELPLVGAYQPKNAATAITALRLLRKKGWDIPDQCIRSGLSKVKWPGRFEVLRKSPAFLLDGAHNAHGMRSTVDSLRLHFPGQQFVFLIAVMADKDVEEMLFQLVPMAKHFVTVKANTDRSLTAQELAEKLEIPEVSAPVTPAPSIEEGVRLARELAGEGPVCALGTLYFSADVRKAVEELL
jgi:dihydrofolate synthase/folylpolyglutamate synthase